MGLSQVFDVNVISNTCAVRRWIVIPEDIYKGPLTKGGFENQGNKVWFNTTSPVILGDLNNSCEVNLCDLTIFSAHWLEQSP